MAETLIWGIHAGQLGEDDSVFIKEKCVALDWGLIGDLSSGPASREHFKQLVAAKYPDLKPGAIPVIKREIEAMIPGVLDQVFNGDGHCA